MKNITQTEWQTCLAKDNNAVILDVRTPKECAEGIIENAIQIDFFDASTFTSTLETLDKSKHYYVYCRSGNRSGQACQLLDRLGAKSTFNLEGGMLGWTGETVLPSNTSKDYKTASIEVQNLKCGGCTATISSKLAALNLVRNIEIDVDKSSVSFDFAEEKDIQLIKEKLKSLGYPATDDQNSMISKMKSVYSCATGKLKQ
ncbi:MAG: rhodanese-like domain-containing protein [Flavobacteriales bacterium]